MRPFDVEVREHVDQSDHSEIENVGVATTAVGRAIVSDYGSIEVCLIPAFIATSGRSKLNRRGYL